MQRALRALLNEVVDYAGVFPPAGLPVEQALRNYARDRAAPEGWLLARFVCPVARLGELAPHVAKLFTPDAPARLSVIGDQDPLTPEFIKDVRLIDQFAKTHGAAARIEALDLRLPPDALREWRPEAIGEALDVMATRLVEHHFSDIEVFLEPSSPADRDEHVIRAVTALKLHDEIRGQPDPERIGLKLRTGGLEVAAIPTAAQIALALIACRDAGIPLRLTAGLHQPLRHSDATRHADLHGFTNVLVAGVLAYARGVDEATAGLVLEERAPEAFAFSEASLRWRDLEAAIDEIEEARTEFMLSFASCSFDEPREALRKLKLL